MYKQVGKTFFLFFYLGYTGKRSDLNCACSKLAIKTLKLSSLGLAETEFVFFCYIEIQQKATYNDVSSDHAKLIDI